MTLIKADAKTLVDGRIAQVDDFLFTTAIMVGVTNNDMHYYDTRYCYEHRSEAEEALKAWDGEGDPPGKWIVQKPEGRYNKAFINEERG